MQVYGLVGQTEEGICPALRAIYLPQSDQPVRKLAYCPRAHVLFVNYLQNNVYIDDKKSCLTSRFF